MRQIREILVSFLYARLSLLKRALLLLSISSITTVLLSGCLVDGVTGTAGSSVQNASIQNTTAPSTSAYTSIALLLQPVFSLLLGSAVDTSASGSVTLAAYTDSACTTLATGTLSLTQNPVTAALGVANFAGISYALPGHLEQAIYLGASAPGGLSACTSVVDILYHFNAGTGYIIGAATAASFGATWEADYNPMSSILDSEGRIVVVGGGPNGSGGSELTVWRFNPDGTFDTSFGGTGMVALGTTGAAGASGASEGDTGYAVQIDSQGRIVISGLSANTSGGLELAIWRFTGGGALDTNFGGTGFITNGSTGAAGAIGSSEYDQPASMLLDSQGKIVIAGWSSTAGGGNWNTVAWRYNTDGTPDTTFAGTGVAVIPLATSTNYNQAYGLQIDPQGRLLLSGSIKNGGTNGYQVAIWRLTPAGVLDSTFGSSGYVLSSTTGATGAAGCNEDDQAVAMQLDSQGRIVIGGLSLNGSGGCGGNGGSEAAIWRYNSDGTVDTSFGGVGYVTSGTTGAAGGTSSGEWDQPYSLKIDSEGRIVLVGSSANAGGGTELAIWRFNANGTADTSFNGTGVVTSGSTGIAGATGSSESDAGGVLQLDWQGRLVVTGWSVDGSGNYRRAVWRYLTNGQLDK